MILYECKSCNGGPCVLVVEDGCPCAPLCCPWGPEDVAEWQEASFDKKGHKC